MARPQKRENNINSKWEKDVGLESKTLQNFRGMFTLYSHFTTTSTSLKKSIVLAWHSKFSSTSQSAGVGELAELWRLTALSIKQNGLGYLADNATPKFYDSQ